MSDPFYVTAAKVEKIDGVHRRAHFEPGTSIDFGVHGPIKAHYNIDAKDLPLPVDYVVASTAG